MKYQEAPRISEKIISTPPPEGITYDLEDPYITNYILLEILGELKTIRYRLDDMRPNNGTFKFP